MIFGTDGIRGKVGRFPLDAATVLALSEVLRVFLGRRGRIVVGRDPRRFGDVLFDQLTRHLDSVEVWDLGVVTTPAVGAEARARNADLGVMITASHNPPEYNGLKFLDRHALKVSTDITATWSRDLEARTMPASGKPGRVIQDHARHYVKLLQEEFSAAELEGQRLGFDFAHGGASYLGREVLNALNVSAEIMGDRPDGGNINHGVGSLHPQRLGALVRECGLDVGFALDGDGDRLVVVDRRGDVIHGDVLLYALFHAVRERHPECCDLVGTIMCGKGLEVLLQEEGYRLHRTSVGDQNIIQHLVSHQLLFGGEPSGHIVLAHILPTGDGLLSALYLARHLRQYPDFLPWAVSRVPVFPTHERAIAVRHKPPLHTLPALQQAADALERRLGDEGRLIIRYSGTEPKIRLFVEARDLTPHQPLINALEAAVMEVLS